MTGVDSRFVIRTHRRGRWLARWLLLVLVFGSEMVYLDVKNHGIEAHATETVLGRVVEEHRGRNQWVIVEYAVLGQVFRNHFGAANLPNLRNHDSVVVRYDPANPLAATIPGSLPTADADRLMELLAVVVVPAAFVLLWRFRDYLDAERERERRV